MNKTWQLQVAKNKFSELVDEAIRNGPQHVTRRGSRAVVVISESEYERLTGPKESLGEFFRKSPLKGLEVERKKDVPRDITL